MWSITRALVLVVVCSCSGKKAAGDDCKLVLEDPARAMVRVTERYPGDPVKVAETIERCVAPEGDECERVDKLVRAIPSMMGSASTFSMPTLEICRDSMTPEMRRCMLPSYVLGHADECARVREQMAQAVIEQVPLTPRPPAAAPACDGPALAIEPGGMTLTSGPKDKRVTTPRRGPADMAWLEERLRTEKRALPDCTTLELSGARGVRYQDVIRAMDVAVKVGFINVGLDDGDPPQPGADPPAPEPLATGTDAIQNAPVLVITKDELTIAAKPIATVADVAAGPDVIEALTQALPSPPPPGRMVILQADETTDMIVITRAIRTLNRAGYRNVLFAVKNK